MGEESPINYGTQQASLGLVRTARDFNCYSTTGSNEVGAVPEDRLTPVDSP